MVLSPSLSSAGEKCFNSLTAWAKLCTVIGLDCTNAAHQSIVQTAVSLVPFCSMARNVPLFGDLRGAGGLVRQQLLLDVFRHRGRRRESVGERKPLSLLAAHNALGTSCLLLVAAGLLRVGGLGSNAAFAPFFGGWTGEDFGYLGIRVSLSEDRWPEPSVCP